MSLLDSILKPTALPYDFQEWKKLPFNERARKVCQAWALQGFGAPPSTVILYFLKIAFYVYMWFVFCSFSTELGPASEVGAWWLNLEALGKAVFWTTLLEVIGLGGASGPLTARYVPPLGAITYYLRPKTIKTPFFYKAPIIGNDSRNIVDILLYIALLVSLVRVCIAPQITPEIVLPVLILLPILGILDKQIYLAARADVWYPAMLCFMFPTQLGGALKVVWFSIWFWAAFSKLTPTFTSVVGVMICNSPFLRFPWLKKMLFRNYPDDLRASSQANLVAHFGTFIEFALPILLVLSINPQIAFYAMVGMTLFHTFIFLNVPMGVPMEWNVMMVYGGWVLFGLYPQYSVFDVSSPILIVTFVFLFLVLTIVGHLFPKYVSFLLSMRYYAGTWAYSVWLFKEGSKQKIEQNIVKTSPDLRVQLGFLYDDIAVQAILSRTIAFRMMHLPSRALHPLLPKAVDNIDEYYWIDGEFLAGEVIGWNFGDGHLHDERLLESIQDRCHFESGELRVIMVESPQLHNGRMEWRIHDAKDGLIEKGFTTISEVKENMPWPEKWPKTNRSSAGKGRASLKAA